MEKVLPRRRTFPAIELETMLAYGKDQEPVIYCAVQLKPYKPCFLVFETFCLKDRIFEEPVKDKLFLTMIFCLTLNDG